MNLQELFETVMAGESEARVRNTKTAVKLLAKAVGHDLPETCSRETYNLPLNRIYILIDKHLQGKGPHTIRNTKNYLSKLFRSAAEKKLLPLPSPQITQQFTYQDFRNRTPRPGSTACIRNGSYFRFSHWPPTLKLEWIDFYHWCTAPLIEGRPAQQKKRPATMNTYRAQFESFFGYLIHQKHLTAHTLCFDQLFTFPLVSDYIHWHVNIRHQKATSTIHQFMAFLQAMSHSYKPNKEFRTALLELHHSLPHHTPIYNKEEAWVPLATLGQVATTLWPTKQPQDYQRGGARAAKRAGLSLMLHLWCCVPYRQRNMREMELGKNLYRNKQGQWVLRFAGEQLKIARKDGKENVFELPFPEHLVPLLEEYLKSWRPLLIARQTTPSPLVFLNANGDCYGLVALNRSVKATVYLHTGIAFHPHLIRSVWATEYIRKTGDIYGAAIMLNDKLETVVKNYAHLNHQGVAEKAYLTMQSSYNPVPLPARPPTKPERRLKIAA